MRLESVMRRPSGRAANMAMLCAILALVGVADARALRGQIAAGGTPVPVERLTDSAFWTLVRDISEPGGVFQYSDNFTSNEMEIGALFTMLRDARVGGGVYLGVGPEQNFSYIASLRPAMAFVIDIRRQAMVQQLMFKAVFEMAKDRADFISLLFSRARPAGLDSTTAVGEMWTAYRAKPTDTAVATATYARITKHLQTRGIALSPEELGMLGHIWQAFTAHGPAITTEIGTRASGGRRSADFAELTGSSLDASGQPRSFLSAEENYQFVKLLHAKNLIVPITGDFAGPKAVRAIGAYLVARGAAVTAFYVSNVEQYLFQDGKQTAFYSNVATLPMAERSVFIRPYAMRVPRGSATPGVPLCPIQPYVSAFVAGRVANYIGSMSCPR